MALPLGKCILEECNSDATEVITIFIREGDRLGPHAVAGFNMEKTMAVCKPHKEMIRRAWG